MIVISFFMILVGIGMIVVWTLDIFKSKDFDRSEGLFKVRNRESGDLMVPHWIAEYLTASGLVISGIGNLISFPCSGSFSLIFLGALFYASLNSLSWSFAKKERFHYAVAMLFGLLVSLTGVIYFAQ